MKPVLLMGVVYAIAVLRAVAVGSVGMFLAVVPGAAFVWFYIPYTCMRKKGFWPWLLWTTRWRLEAILIPFQDILSNDGVYLLRLLIAMVLGGLVGLERQSRGRAAGLRTNILVCLGSAVIIIAFEKLSLELNVDARSAIRMDPARAAAGVITGIGFLGAGTIVKSRNFVRGLTTAASIWVVSAIGVTVGLGEYVISFFVTLLVLLALYVLHRLPIESDYYFSLQLAWGGDLNLVTEISHQLDQKGIQIKNRSIVHAAKTRNCKATLVLRTRGEEQNAEILNMLKDDTRFDSVSWN